MEPLYTGCSRFTPDAAALHRMQPLYSGARAAQATAKNTFFMSKEEKAPPRPALAAL